MERPTDIFGSSNNYHHDEISEKLLSHCPALSSDRRIQKEVIWVMGIMALEATPFSTYRSIRLQPPVANVN